MSAPDQLEEMSGYRRLKVGDVLPDGYQYRYKQAVDWTPWLNGECVGIKIGNGNRSSIQYRAPLLRAARSSGKVKT